MGERISWAEGAQQLRALQSLMLEVIAKEAPEVGMILRTDEPELLIEYLNRAKQKEPLTQDIVIRMSSMGVLLYRPITKETSDGKENGKTHDSQTRSDL